MFDGLADVINGSVQANEQYTRLPADDQKAMNFVWLTAKASTIGQANPNGMGETSRDQLMQYASGLGVNIPMDADNDFTFDKEFFFLYNKRMSPEAIKFLDNALAEVFADGEVQETLKKSFFIPNFRTSAEAQQHLKAKSDSYAKIINSLHK
ncbi:hypothetical protein AB8616_19940 [Marinomonas sp. RS-M-Aa-14]|uniref:hypothetical protein n=1 Tax=Marinomonas sp. RS-M-Aa-14 TaxID=3241169 RepID=UPI003AB0DDDC